MTAENPFSKKHWNLTQQGQIHRTSPHQVEQLTAEAAEEDLKRERRIEWLKEQIKHLQHELRELQANG